jgi:hypothetical protein
MCAVLLRRDIGSRHASLVGSAEEDISDSPVHVLERVGFPRSRHYTQVSWNNLPLLTSFCFWALIGHCCEAFSMCSHSARECDHTGSDWYSLAP